MIGQNYKVRELKEIPTNTTKAKVQRMYTNLAIRTVRATIQLAVSKVNSTSIIPKPYRAKTLNEKHIRIIVEELGPPPGYRDFTV